jgi:Domain of unknown function (DUF1883)
MRRRIRYAWSDLGEREEGTTVVVRMRGPANVLLLDAVNFARYRGGRSFAYVGGFRRHCEARLVVPRDGQWYVVLDLGGRPGRAHGAIQVLAPDESAPHDRELATAGAP